MKLARVKLYAKAMRQIREKYLVCMHIAGGQPSRGTEIITIKFKNGGGGVFRNIFVEDGMMVFVTGYHKGFGQSAQPKIVHQFLPQEVGELLFYYL